MKKILLTISALFAFCTAFSQGQSLWLGDTNVKKSVIKDLGDGSQAVAAFLYLGKTGICLLDMTLSSYPPYIASGIALDSHHSISDIAVADEEIFFCGVDSLNNCAYIGHTTENDINTSPYTYRIYDLRDVWSLAKLVAYKVPGSSTKYNIVAYGYNQNGKICHFVEALYDKSATPNYFNTSYTLYSDSTQYKWSMNILTTDDYVVFVYRDYFNAYDYYIASCPKTNPLSTINIYRMIGINITMDRQNISATALDHNNIAISYYTSNDIYQDQIDIHCIDVSTMVDYNHQAFPVIEKCTPPQMTYLSTPHTVVMMLEYIYPDNPPAPWNVNYGYPSFVYIDLNQTSSYITDWLYSDKQYRFSGLTNFSGKWFMGTTYADHWYIERYTTPPPSAPLSSCFYNSTVKVAIPSDVRILPITTPSGLSHTGYLYDFGSQHNPPIAIECIHP